MKMKKKIIASLLLSAALLSTSTSVFADEKDDRIAELEATIVTLESENEDLRATIAELEEKLSEATPKSSNQDEYKIGETWIVEGQWKLTIDSVEETMERNEFSDKNPSAVYIISYTYENLGYESDFMDGLFISLDDGIVDSSGTMGYTYPCDVAMYPQETPVGAKCTAQSAIGVDNSGDFKIHFSDYDGTETIQKAVFSISLDAEDAE